MKIMVIGAGYVGLTLSVCLANDAHQVICIDRDAEKIQHLKNRQLTIYEPELNDYFDSAIEMGRLLFNTALPDMPADVYIIAVGTPSLLTGEADISFVLAAAMDIANKIQDDALIVIKSTVPVGTAAEVEKRIHKILNARQLDVSIHVVSNPEFLREGCAVKDFLAPDRIVIGLGNTSIQPIFNALYAEQRKKGVKIFYVTNEEAEMSKYAANGLLAAKLSYINEIASLCDKLKVDVSVVRDIVAEDHRINPEFLNPGCGYGGSCFPKDVQALIKMSRQNGVEPMMFQAIHDRNQTQKNNVVHVLLDEFNGNLRNVSIAVLGLTFKPNTDDCRESPSMAVINKLIENKAAIKAYDPTFTIERKNIPQEWLNYPNLKILENPYSATKDAEALILMTDWPVFQALDFEEIKSKMRGNLILDGRNCLNKGKLQELGFFYRGIGI